MMGIPIELILSLYIVYFGLKFVQPYNQIESKTSISSTNDESNNQESFLNLLKSFAKNNPKKDKISFKTLEHEVSRERQAFHSMKNELQIAQNSNSYKKRNFLEISKTNENIVTSKREAQNLDPAITGSNVNRQLPDHNDTFQSIRAKNAAFVDKSDYIMKLIESERRFYRMCRPGRFGKSNFLQMLNAFFRGEKALFEGLAVYDKHDWQKTYPVIYLDFGSMDFGSFYAFQTCLDREIVRIGRLYGIELDADLPLYPDELEDYHLLYCCKNDSKMGQLIDHLSDGGRNEQSVVVLIDEFDWPRQRYSPRNALTNVRDRTIFQNILNPFLHQFERMKRYIRFLFATCTTITSYQSRSRNRYPDCPMELHDLTFDPQFSRMIGLTGTELKNDLKSHVDALTTSQSNGENFDSKIQRLKKYYNGYCFSRENVSEADDECRLYNFHSVMTCLREKKLGYLWHPAADPKYGIVDDYQISDNYQVSSWWTGENAMRYVSRVGSDTFLISRDELERSEHRANRIPMNVCMVLYGYLTLRGYDERSDKYTLAFPNEEIRQSFHRGVLKFLLGKEMSPVDFVEACTAVRAAGLVGGAKNFVHSLNSLAFTPVDNQTHVYFHKYPQMVYFPDRIVDVFKTCDISLRENTIGGYDGGFEIEPYNVKRITNRMDAGYEYFGLKMNLSDRVECRIRFEFEKSVSSAANVLLREMGDHTERLELGDRIIHLLAINIDRLDAPIGDWIWMTHAGGKYVSVQASHPRYSTMYNAYVVSAQDTLKTSDT